MDLLRTAGDPWKAAGRWRLVALVFIVWTVLLGGQVVAIQEADHHLREEAAKLQAADERLKAADKQLKAADAELKTQCLALAANTEKVVKHLDQCLLGHGKVGFQFNSH